MRVGDIYIWHSYPHQKDGEVKDRWFLFLGEVRNDPFDDDSAVYVVFPTKVRTKSLSSIPIHFPPFSKPFVPERSVCTLFTAV
jgi:hypothetical protein